MSNRDKCFKGTKESVKSLMSHLPEAEVDRFINKALDVAQDLDTLAETKQLNAVERKKFVRNKLKEYLKEQQIEMDRYLKERKMDKLKRDEIMSRLIQYGDSPKAMANGLEAELVGGFKAKGGEGNSVAAHTVSLKTKYYNIFDTLKHKGLYDVFASGEKELAIARETEQLALKEKGKPGITGDKDALEIAKTVHRFNQELLLDKQDAGILVREMPGYIGPQSHDRMRVSSEDFEVWKNNTLKKLDYDKTFGKNQSEARINRFMREAYEDIAYGKQQREIESGGDSFLALSGRKQKTAHGLSAERELHFKDATNWHEYNQQYGKHSMYQSIHAAINSQTRKIALVAKFGTDPMTSYTQVKQKIGNEFAKEVTTAEKALKRAEASGAEEAKLEQLRSDVEKADKRYKEWLNRAGEGKQIDVRFKEVEGHTNVPSGNMLAQTASGLRAWSSLTTLGQATLALATDPGHIGLNLTGALGENYLSGFTRALSEYTAVLKPAERAEFLKALNIMAENNLMAIHKDIYGDDVKPGMTAKALEKFFKYNGLSATSETGRFAMAKTFADILTSYKGLEYKDLNIQTQSTLARFKISPDEWNIMKMGIEALGEQKIELMTPDGIRAIDPKSINPENPRAARKTLEDLAQKYAMMLNNFADTTSMTGTANTRATLLQGTQAGTWTGEAARFISQLKTPALQVYNMLSQNIHNNANIKYDKMYNAFLTGNNLTTFAQFIPVMAGLAYASLSAKALLKGETPPDPRKKEVMWDIVIRSGVGGLYADFALGEYDRAYRNAVTDFVGPTGQKTNEVFKIWAKAIRGEPVSRDAWNFMVRSIPGNNHLLFGPLFQHTIGDMVQENMSQGYLERRKRRLEEERGSTLIGR